MQRTCNDANGFLENRNLKKALFSIQFSAFSAILEMASILQTTMPLHGISPRYKNQRRDNLVSS